MIIQIYTDGGSLNNPGQSAYAYIIYIDNRIEQAAERMGVSTNNIAEYTAVVSALEKIKSIKPPKTDSIILNSDSKLLVNQLNGLYKVKNSQIRNMVIKIRILEQEVKIPISYRYIPREKNTLADALVKSVLK